MPNTAMSHRKVKKLWGTGQISDLIGTNPKTVATWIDAGELKGVRLPGLNERRVHRDVLRAFCEKYEYTWALDVLNAEEGLPRVTPQDPADAPGKPGHTAKPKGRPKKK